MTDSYFESEDKLDFPTAERIVRQYLREKHGTRERTTTVDVLSSTEYPNTQHNRERVFGALERYCRPTGDNWAGRMIFEMPEEFDQP